jgi:hypothetical protein
MSHGAEWTLAAVAIVLLVGLLELKPSWGALMLFSVVLIMLAHGVRKGTVERPSF